MCEKYLQVQCSCTIVWSGGHIEFSTGAEWYFTTTPDTLERAVTRRWQVVKGDDNLYVKDFKVLQVRDDVPASRNQIGA